MEKTLLEELGEKYGVKIIYCPKFHCELNAIEGLWCYMKRYVRDKTDQTYRRMKELINISRDIFKTKRIGAKLIRRFWNTIIAYSGNKTHIEILTKFFGEKCKDTIVSHTKIRNTKL